MSLHTIYANPQYYQPTGMWQTMLDSLQGVEAKWPGGFPKSEGEYSRLVERNHNRTKATTERVLISLMDAHCLTVGEIAKDIEMSDSRVKSILNMLREKDLVSRSCIERRFYWKLNESPRLPDGFTVKVSADHRVGRDGGVL